MAKIVHDLQSTSLVSRRVDAPRRPGCVRRADLRGPQPLTNCKRSARDCSLAIVELMLKGLPSASHVSERRRPRADRRSLVINGEQKRRSRLAGRPLPFHDLTHTFNKIHAPGPLGAHGPRGDHDGRPVRLRSARSQAQLRCPRRQSQRDSARRRPRSQNDRPDDTDPSATRRHASAKRARTHRPPGECAIPTAHALTQYLITFSFHPSRAQTGSLLINVANRSPPASPSDFRLQSTT